MRLPVPRGTRGAVSPLLPLRPPPHCTRAARDCSDPATLTSRRSLRRLPTWRGDGSSEWRVHRRPCFTYEAPPRPRAPHLVGVTKDGTTTVDKPKKEREQTGERTTGANGEWGGLSGERQTARGGERRRRPPVGPSPKPLQRGVPRRRFPRCSRCRRRPLGACRRAGERSDRRGRGGGAPAGRATRAPANRGRGGYVERHRMDGGRRRAGSAPPLHTLSTNCPSSCVPLPVCAAGWGGARVLRAAWMHPLFLLVQGV